jgi:hypothetical protein
MSRNIDQEMLRKIHRVFAQIKKGMFVYVPKPQFELLFELLKDIARNSSRDSLKQRIAKLLTLIYDAKVKTYSKVIKECKEISGYCDEEYKNVCSAIIEYAKSGYPVLAITCSGKTFNVDNLRDVVSRGVCEPRSVLGSIYIVSCSVTEDIVDIIEKILFNNSSRFL